MTANYMQPQWHMESYYLLYTIAGRRHGNNNGVSSVEFGRQWFEKLLSGKGTSGTPQYLTTLPADAHHAQCAYYGQHGRR